MNRHIPSDLPAVNWATTYARPEDRRRRDAAILAAAQAVIARACRCRPDQAFDALLDAAQHYHLGALQLARGLLELIGDLPGRPDTLRGPAAVAFQHWGQRLVRTNQLTPTRPTNELPDRTAAKTIGPRRLTGGESL